MEARKAQASGIFSQARSAAVGTGGVRIGYGKA